MKDPPYIPFALPHITGAEKAAVAEALDSGWLTSGPRAGRFEQEFARRVGAAHGVAVSSCTAAMHLALEALGVTAGHEVVVPTMTFAATAEVVRYLGARPVLADVLPGDLTLDPRALQRAITPRTRAVIPVHFAGQACDMEPILQTCRGAGVAVVEDAAHAFPASHGGRPVGSLGDVTCFSFYATKTLTTGEGGMAVTGSERLAERMRLMSLHGISRDAWLRDGAEESWRYEIIAPGFKYNLSDVAAALGLAQLQRADEMLGRRREIARRYTAAFAGAALEPLWVRDFDAHAWQLFVVQLRQEQLTIGRSRFIEELKARGVGATVHFIPLHLHPYYRETYGHAPRDFPVALASHERLVSLPIYSRMSDGQVERAAGAVLDVLARFRR